MVCVFIDKNGTTVAQIVQACFFFFTIFETVHRSTAVVRGQHQNFSLVYIPDLCS